MLVTLNITRELACVLLLIVNISQIFDFKDWCKLCNMLLCFDNNPTYQCKKAFESARHVELVVSQSILHLASFGILVIPSCKEKLRHCKEYGCGKSNVTVKTITGWTKITG